MSHAGIWEQVFETLTADRDNQYLMIDSTCVLISRPHPEKGTKDQALGRSRGGLSTKIHMLAEALGRPSRSIVTTGQVGDITQAPPLLEWQIGTAVLADEAYASNALREKIAGMGAEAVIPSNRSRKIIIAHDELIYMHHNRIERCFNRMKHFRRFSTRYDRRTIHFQGFVYLVAAMLWLR